jgi:hypothetical protein
MLRRAIREAAFFAAYLLLSIALTWPLAIHLSTTVSDLGDPLLTSWIIDWTSHALLHQPLRLFDAPMFYPSVTPLAFSEHLAGVALLTLPFHLAGLPPLAVCNLGLLLGFALSGYGAFVLARLFVASRMAAFVAGIFFAFVSFKFDHLAHMQIISSGWVPLILAALIAYCRKPTWKRAALFGAAFAMNGLTNIYYLLFTAAAVGTALIVLFLIDPQRRDVKFWLRAIGALALAGLVLLPFLLPYRTVSKLYNMKRPEAEVKAGSGHLDDWLRATPRSRLYGNHVPPDSHHHEREVFPGLLPILLIGAAILMTPRRERAAGTSAVDPRLLRALDVLIVFLAMLAIMAMMSEPRFRFRLFDRTILSVRDSDVPLIGFLLAVLARVSLQLPKAWGEGRSLRDSVRDSRFDLGAWLAIVWIVAGVLGTLGLNSFFYRFLFERIEAYQSIRAPGRWAVVAYAGMVPWVAIGAQQLLARRRRLVAAALLLAALVDVWPDVQWEQALSDAPPVDRWLKKEQVAPVVEWPVDNWLAFRYLLAATHHHLPLMNGSSGWEGPVYRDMRMSSEGRSYNWTLRLAETNGCKLLVVHGHWLQDFADSARVRATLERAVRERRIAFLRRFDHGVEGDFVFAITRNFPDWHRLAPPNVPDGAGQLPPQTLATFLAGQPTYNLGTFGKLESRPAVVEGALTIQGWAISPHGVKNVYVWVNERRLKYEAWRVKRPEITRAFPWYYENECGFTLTIAKRPFSVPRDTDVQVEIVDAAGKHTWLEDHLFIWDAQPPTHGGL